MLIYQPRKTREYDAVGIMGAQDCGGQKYIRVIRGKRGQRRGKKSAEWNSKRSSPWIPLTDFESQGSSSKSALAASGMVFFGKEFTELRDHIAAFDGYKQAAVFKRPGWGPECLFAFPNGEVIGKRDGERVAIVFEKQRSRVTAAGSHDAWLREVANPLAGHEIAEFCLMLALAPALLAPAGAPLNFGIELSGPPATGKSTIANLAASVAGPAEGQDGGYVVSMNSTANAIDQLMPDFDGFPLILEEWNLLVFGEGASAGKATVDIISRMSDGRPKRRHNHGDKPRSRFLWLTSTNRPWYERADKLTQFEKSAIADRMITIPIGEPDAGGVFNANKLGERTVGKLSAELAKASRKFHGSAYRIFLAYLADYLREFGKDPLEDEVASLRQRFERMLTRRDIKVSERLASAMAFVFAAGRLAKKAGALPDSFNVRRSVLYVLERHMEVRKAMRSPLDILLDLIDDPNTVDWRNETGTMPIKTFGGACAVLWEGKSGPELILTNDQLRRLTSDPRAFLGDPDLAPIIKRTNDRPSRYRTLVAGQREQMRCFRLDMLLDLRSGRTTR